MINKIEVSPTRVPSEDVDKLVNALMACNRSIQRELKFIANGRKEPSTESSRYSGLLKTKEDLERQLTDHGVQVNRTLGMKPDATTLFYSRGSAFSSCAKPKEDEVEKNTSTESKNSI